jgi:excisionase family DNA binding protein
MEPVIASEVDPCELLTVPAAARLMAVCRRTIEKYLRAGDLRSVKIGRCRRIRRADLLDFLDRRNAGGWRRSPEAPSPWELPPPPLYEGPDGGEGISF